MMTTFARVFLFFLYFVCQWFKAKISILNQTNKYQRRVESWVTDWRFLFFYIFCCNTSIKDLTLVVLLSYNVIRGTAKRTDKTTNNNSPRIKKNAYNCSFQAHNKGGIAFSKWFSYHFDCKRLRFINEAKKIIPNVLTTFCTFVFMRFGRDDVLLPAMTAAVAVGFEKTPLD